MDSTTNAFSGTSLGSSTWAAGVPVSLVRARSRERDSNSSLESISIKGNSWQGKDMEVAY